MALFKDEYDAKKYIEWAKEIDPSTRESMRPWTKDWPVDFELTTPGTAENLMTVSPGKETVNLFTDPSVETGITLFTAVDSTLTHDSVEYKYGSKSLKCTPDGTAAGEGFSFDIGLYPPKKPIAVSCWIKGGAAGNAYIVLEDADGNTLATGAQIDLNAGDYVRASVTWFSEDAVVKNITAKVLTAATHSNAFYCDGFQVEPHETITPYCDGDQGIDYEWFGTAHASPSKRYPHIRFIRGGHLHITRDCYIAFDRDADSSATNAEDRGEFVKAGSDWNMTGHSIAVMSKISIINYWPGEKPRIWGRLWGC